MTLSTPPPLPPCPFVAGPMITDARLFLGRKYELRRITNLMTGVQPTSVNVFGERRIGKSSLLYHFFQTRKDTPDANQYVVVYLSLQNINCQSRSSFYQAVAQELLSHPSVQRRNDLSSTLSVDLLDHAGFVNTLKQWKQNKVLPVLCLDEFETLLKYPDEFDDSFYDHLRSLMDSNALMLVVASHKSLDV